MLINCTPWFLRPLTGYPVALVTYYCLRKATKECIPIVRERLHNTALLKADPDFAWTPPVSDTVLLVRNQNTHLIVIP
jgi:hypothetical protein